MTNPALRDRLAEIIKRASRQYPYGSDIDEGCRGIAAVLLASEEWQAREAAVEALDLVSTKPPPNSGPFTLVPSDWIRQARATLARLATVRGTA